MSGHPLERRIADDDVDRPVGTPRGDIHLKVGRGWAIVAGPFDRLGRGVDAGRLGLGSASAQDRGEVAGAAAQIDHGGGWAGNAGDEIDERTAPLVGEAEALLWIPDAHSRHSRTNRLVLVALSCWKHPRTRPGDGPVRSVTMSESHDTGTRYEEFKVSGDGLVAKVRELIREGNVRRVFIKNEKGEVLLEIPLTAGVAVTALAAMVSPVLVAVGAIAALLTPATVGVERRVSPDEESGGDHVVVED